MKKNLRKGKKPSSHQREALLQSRLLKYSAAAGTAMIGAQQADAAVNAQLNQNIMITGNDFFDLDLDGDGTSDLRFRLNSNSNGNGVNRFSYQSTSYRNTTYTSAPVNPTGGTYLGTDPYGDPNATNGGTYSTIVGGMRDRVFVRYSSTSERVSNFGGAYVSNIGFGGRVATSASARKFGDSSLISVLDFDSGATSRARVGTLMERYTYRRTYRQTTYQKQMLTAGGNPVSTYAHPTLQARTSSRATGPYTSGTGQGEFFGDRGFLGVEFRNSSGGVHNGWVDLELALGRQSGNKLTIHGWGFETVEGLGINAGSTESLIPEPTGLAMLATGAAGVAALRRNRRKQATGEKQTKA